MRRFARHGRRGRAAAIEYREANMATETGNPGIRRTKGHGKLYDSIVDTVGDTPVVRVNHIAPEGVRMYVKCEFFNPPPR
jgi:hypothetical protein